MKTLKPKQRGSKVLALILSLGLVGFSTTGAQARILFQDDTFHDIESENILIDSNGTGGENTGIQFGNDSTASENGSIIWDITANEFQFNNTIDTTGGLDVAGDVEFNDATQVRLREDPDPNTNAACTDLGEVIIDTTDEQLQICTVVGAPGTWTTIGDDVSGYLTSDTSDTFGDGAGAETLTIGDGTNGDTLLFAANSILDASNADQFIIPTGTANSPGDACTAGELYFDTDTSQLLTCGAGGTFETSAPQDFEDVYAYDADNTLTASGTFDIDATGAVGVDSDAGLTFGGAGISLTSDGGALSLTGDGTNDIDLSNTGAALDFDAATFDVLTTAGFSIDGGAASNVSTSAGDLTLEATAGSTVISGGEAVADAIQIQTGNVAGGIDIDSGTGGIAIDSTGAVSVDAVGASNVTTDSGDLTLSTTTTGNVNITGADSITFDDGTLTTAVDLNVSETALSANYTENGIIDALNDFQSLTEGAEGATFVATDASDFTNFTPAGDTVQDALEAIDTQLGATSGRNEQLVFSPEYPDTVVSRDGSDNRGRLDAAYDAVNDRNYYEWTSQRGTLQDIDLRFRFVLPTDYVTTGDFNLDYQTGVAAAANNAVDVSVINVTDSNTVCATSTGLSGTAWTTETIAAATIDAGCTGGNTLDAGDTVEIVIKLQADNTASAYARSGVINFEYSNT